MPPKHSRSPVGPTKAPHKQLVKGPRKAPKKNAPNFKRQRGETSSEDADYITETTTDSDDDSTTTSETTGRATAEASDGSSTDSDPRPAGRGRGTGRGRGRPVSEKTKKQRDLRAGATGAALPAIAAPEGPVPLTPEKKQEYAARRTHTHEQLPKRPTASMRNGRTTVDSSTTIVNGNPTMNDVRGRQSNKTTYNYGAVHNNDAGRDVNTGDGNYKAEVSGTGHRIAQGGGGGGGGGDGARVVEDRSTTNAWTVNIKLYVVGVAGLALAAAKIRQVYTQEDNALTSIVDAALGPLCKGGTVALKSCKGLLSKILPLGKTISSTQGSADHSSAAQQSIMTSTPMQLAASAFTGTNSEQQYAYAHAPAPGGQQQQRR